MFKVISLLLLYIQIQQKVIVYLMGSVLGKHVMRHVYDEPVDRPYRKLQVDQMPIIEVLEKLDYRKLLAEYQMTHGKELKLVITALILPNHFKNMLSLYPFIRIMFTISYSYF